MLELAPEVWVRLHLLPFSPSWLLLQSQVSKIKKNTFIHFNITVNKGLYFLFTFYKSHIYTAMSFKEVTPLTREPNNAVWTSHAIMNPQTSSFCYNLDDVFITG